MLKYYTTNSAKNQALFLFFLMIKNLLIVRIYNIIIKYMIYLYLPLLEAHLIENGLS